MSVFVIDGEGFEADRLKEFEEALSPLAQSDCPLSVEISFVGEKEIQTLNRTYRSCDRVTDVLSFPAMDNIKNKVLRAAEHPFETDEEGRLFLGSIAICTARAKEQAGVRAFLRARALLSCRARNFALPRLRPRGRKG